MRRVVGGERFARVLASKREDRDRADRYSTAVQGSAVVAVYADSDDSIEQAQAVMNRTDMDCEEYQSAYRYGSTLGSDQRYEGRNDWVDLESDVKRDWESSQPGTWDRMKNSVRYAWERMRNGRPADPHPQ